MALLDDLRAFAPDRDWQPSEMGTSAGGMRSFNFTQRKPWRSHESVASGGVIVTRAVLHDGRTWTVTEDDEGSSSCMGDDGIRRTRRYRETTEPPQPQGVE